MKEVSALALVLSLLALVFSLSGIVMPESDIPERRFYYVEGTTDISCSTDSWIDVAQMSLSVTIESGDVALIEYAMSLSIYPSDTVAFGYVRILRDSTVVEETVFGLYLLFDYPSPSPTMSILAIDTPSSGTYTYKVQWSRYYSCSKLECKPSSQQYRTFTIDLI